MLHTLQEADHYDYKSQEEQGRTSEYQTTSTRRPSARAKPRPAFFDAMRQKIHLAKADKAAGALLKTRPSRHENDQDEEEWEA